jgi:hypothetical protein
MSVSVVGLYQRLSAAFERFFSGHRFAIGGRHVGLARDLVCGVPVSGTTVPHRGVRGSPSRTASSTASPVCRAGHGTGRRTRPGEVTRPRGTCPNAGRTSSGQLVAGELSPLQVHW